MKNKTKNIFIFGFFLIFIAFWIVIFHYVNPQEIVAKIGVTNGYLILFFLGAFGGMSTFTGPSYLAALATLAIAGLNPVWIAIVGGIGVAVGDSVIFLVGLNAGRKAPEGFHERIDKWTKRLQNKPRYFIAIFLFSYIAFTPFPNELATIPLGLIGYRPKLIIPCIALGNIANAFITATLAIAGISLFY